MWTFVWGVIVGVLLVLSLAFVYFLGPFSPTAPKTPFADQFQPIRLPSALREFLTANKEGDASNWESCYSLSLILHFLYQEHKDTRRLRRWFLKRLQLELNDIVTRSTAGRLIQDIRVRDLTTGSQFPVLKSANVNSYRMCDDGEGFDSLSLLLDIDYTGAFQASVDVSMPFGRYAQLSIKVARLAGKALLTMERDPYTHWSIAFEEMPLLDFKVESQWQGKQLKHVIPLITQQLRRVIQRKHVLPNYKIRYRPFFSNPLLVPSPPIDSLEHIRTTGGLEVTVLQCTRLNIALAASDHSEVYCTLTMEQRPFLHNSTTTSVHCYSVLLNYVHHGAADLLGLSFNRSVAELGLRVVQVDSVSPGSGAERSGFLAGDVLLAVNNVPIQSERQASRLLCGTTGELSVLIERNLSQPDPVPSVHPEDVLIKNGSLDEGFLLLGGAAHLRGKLAPLRPAQRSLVEHSRIPVQRQRSHSAADIMTIAGDSQLDDIDGTRKEAGDDRVVSLPNSPRATIDHSPIANFEMRKVRSEAQMDDAELNLDLVVKPRIVETLVATPIREDSTPTSSVDLFDSEQSAVTDRILSERVSMRALMSTMKASSNPDVSADNELSSPFQRASFRVDDRPVSRRERIQARAAEVHARATEMAVAGKARMSDLWARRKESSSHIELAAEALDDELLNESPSASPRLARKHCGNVERIKRTIIAHSRRSKKETVHEDGDDNSLEEDSSQEPVRSRSTKGLALDKNVLWGQSLHFQLESADSKYLNVSVLSRVELAKDSLTSDAPCSINEPTKPTMLAYTSIPICQVLDDCQMTLSNCHREVFTLRAPLNSLTRECALADEVSTHSGFDARLCFGDILLGFRYFPDGLPQGVALNQQLSDSSDKEDEGDVDSAISVVNVESSETQPSPRTPLCGGHRFEGVLLKSGRTCAVCKGKVWLKNASRCARCQLLCHHKCVVKLSDALTLCEPNRVIDDSNFEVLDGKALSCSDAPSFLDDATSSREAVHELLETSASPSPTHTAASALVDGDGATITRRRRIANRMTEWTSTWGRMNRRKTPQSTADPTKSSPKEPSFSSSASKQSTDAIVSVESTIPDVFLSLGMGGELSGMRFQPGNAYNEEMISEAKNVGKDLYRFMRPIERKAKINEQMDRLRGIISATTSERLTVLETSKADNDSPQFVALERRLQALAVLMLHFCAALQNCQHLEEEHGEAKQASNESGDITMEAGEGSGRSGNGKGSEGGGHRSVDSSSISTTSLE